MTCLARIPQKWLRGCGKDFAQKQGFAQRIESVRTETFGLKLRHRTLREG
jgi:hypothetical protein